MTSGTLPGIPSRIEFHGPADVSALWTRFVDAYTKNGSLTSYLDAAASLDDLAFGQGLDKMKALHATDPAGYRRKRKAIEDAARALSTMTTSVAIRPLHRALLTALVDQWAQLESSHGLRPASSLSPGAGVKSADRDAEYEHRADVLNTPAGGLLAGVLKMAVSSTIQAGALSVQRRFQHSFRGLTLDDVLPIAYEQFDKVLFKFDPRVGRATFNTYVIGGLKRFLPAEVARRFEREHRIGSLPSEATNGDRSFSLAERADASMQTPIEALIANEDADAAKHLPSVLDRLTPKERSVLRLRFGLEDGQRYTLEEVGRRLEMSKQGVLIAERRALKHCRNLLDPNEDSESPSPTPRGRVR